MKVNPAATKRFVQSATRLRPGGGLVVAGLAASVPGGEGHVESRLSLGMNLSGIYQWAA